MIVPDVLGARIRRNRRRKRLGPEACCCLCGCQGPGLEIHHPAGQANDGLEAILCRTCHVKAHEELRDNGVSPEYEPCLARRAERVMAAIDIFLEMFNERRAVALEVEYLTREATFSPGNDTRERALRVLASAPAVLKSIGEAWLRAMDMRWGLPTRKGGK